LSLRAVLLFAGLAAATPAAAATIAYEGEDAARLTCAAMLSLASNHAEADGRLKPGAHDKSRAAVAQLLRPLPGTRDEKARAMQATADRLMLQFKPDALKAEFERTLPACGRFF
jgi:hypothetical protein